MKRIKPKSLVVRLRGLFLLSFYSFVLAGCAGQHEQKVTGAEALQRQHYSDVRVMSWNVKLNSILAPEGARYESFARIVRAIDPDVIGLQEVAQAGLAEQLTLLMNNYIPLENGESWQVHTISDNALISRYPLQQQSGELPVRYPIPELGAPNFHFGYATALVDIPGDLGDTSIYVVAMHNKSGAGKENVRLRQVQSDSIVRWIRNLRESEQPNSIPNNTPIVILGDMNVVPDASMQPFQTLLNGDIVDEATFGPDFRIDWDGTDMADARPSHNGKEQNDYTWRNDEMPFAPSALDRIIFTDSVMSVRQRFILNTMMMSADELTALGLQKTDVLYGARAGEYDHLPLVTDFSLRSERSE
jgi:endonuclease/exonuclease/phosphatase family metal-dependent hydrolase